MLIDYLQLVQVDGVRDAGKAASEVSKSLKELARELKISIIALAQLNPTLGARLAAEPVGQ